MADQTPSPSIIPNISSSNKSSHRIAEKIERNRTVLLYFHHIHLLKQK